MTQEREMATGREGCLRIKKDSENMNAFNLKEHELTVEEVHRNLPPSAFYEHAILYEKDAHIAENGALVAYSGVKTGRSPKDKRVVKHSHSFPMLAAPQTV